MNARLALFILIGLASLGLATGAEAVDHAAPDYRLGQGYPLGSTGLRLGGYTSLHAEAPRTGPWRVGLSDLSLFLSWQASDRLRFFSELEAGDAFTATEGGRAGGHDARFELERLYGDALVTDSLALRFGKFLTPVGRWNLLHADPLVWTATRPVATESLFSKHATGLMLLGHIPLMERRLEYQVYADLTRSLDPHRSENPFDNAAGLHTLYALSEQLQVGASYLSFELNTDRHRRHHLAGVEANWRHRRYELTTEWVYRASQDRGASLWQGFVQGVAPIAGDWYAVGRYELFQQPGNLGTGQVGVLGFAYRPLPPLVVKFEYRLGTHNEQTAPDGFYTSFAVLF
ncbi:MAG: hypothetical protein FIA97_20225 [Methylococcaceae bacterium]|nr:hypothetical protein [Methylococcaceae bacterium]